MNILLTHVYTAENKGDAGIVAGMLGEIARILPNAKVTIAAMEEPENNPYREEKASVTTSFFYEAIYRDERAWVRILRTLWIIPATVLYTMIYRLTQIRLQALTGKACAQILRAYERADLVIPVGGCYLRGNNSLQSTVTIVLQLHAIVIAWLMGKPIYLYPQSIGPLPRTPLRHLVGWTLNLTQAVYVREAISEKLSRQIGVRRRLIHRGVDAGFLLPNYRLPQHLAKKYNLIPHRTVGITVRQWLAPKEQDNYELTIAKIADYIVHKFEFSVVFIPQVTASHHHDDDRLTSIRVYTKIRHKDRVKVITDRINHRDIKALYGAMEWFIGTRMHSNIFALTAGVPTIAIEYEHKTRGIMQEMGLEKWLVKIEDVSYPTMRKNFDRLVAEGDEYRKYLRNFVPQYVAKAKRPMTEILEHYRYAS